MADDGPVDILELGSPPSRPGRQLVWCTLVALVIGGVVGFVIGTHHPVRPAPGAAVPSAASATPSVAPRLLAATGRRCSAQVGDRLQVGIEMHNIGDTSVELIGLDATLPLGGLHPVSRTLGSCGQLPSDPNEETLVAHGLGWVSITFDVQMPCPAPLPVGFALLYRSNGSTDSEELPGFVDLGDVPYSRCPAPS